MFWKCDETGAFSLWEDETIVLTGYASAEESGGRSIDTRSAVFVGREDTDEGMTLIYESDNGLLLRETLGMLQGAPYAVCALSDRSGSLVETNHLEPLIINGNEAFGLPLFDNLFMKMLLVPYDNDQWNRYEAVPLRVGRTSHELTVLLDEDTREGLLIGAVDFDDWKNGIVCSHSATRELHCVSGIADLMTKDVCPHGTLIGESVRSARMVLIHSEDYRDALEQYGKLLRKLRPPMPWEEGVPFGFNCFSGLARKMDLRIYEKTARFLREELVPRGFENNGFTYMNLDGGWQRLEEKERLRIRDEIHAAGQKAGVYDGPFGFRPFRGYTKWEDEVPGFPGTTYADIVLRDGKGELLPPVDGLYALDCTHPAWFKLTERKFEYYKKCGYDYLKIDFLTHGAMEGVHYDKSIRTGRQAITKAYRFMAELVENMGYPFFLSTSIAPLFPYGYSHARRYCCDTFGTNQYIEYALNTQTYGWWENNTLYAFNDPDHLTLLKSFNIPRDTLEGEARARYTTGAIAGSVMLLSDDYDRPEAVERALRFAVNPEINAIARSRTAFRPVEANGSSASHAYTASVNGAIYMAVFSWRLCPETIIVNCGRAGIPAGKYADIWTGREYDLSSGCLVWNTDSCDALMLKFMQ